MSILNVNQIQPVGGGNTITVAASDVSSAGADSSAGFGSGSGPLAASDAEASVNCRSIPFPTTWHTRGIPCLLFAER